MEKKPLFEIMQTDDQELKDTLKVKLSEAAGSGPSEKAIHDLSAALTAVRLTLLGTSLPDGATDRDIRKMTQMTNHVKILEHAIAELIKLLSGGDRR